MIHIEEAEEVYPSEFFNHPRYERKIDFLIRRYHQASFYLKVNQVGLPDYNFKWSVNPDPEWIQKPCPSTRFGQCMDSMLYYSDVEFKALLFFLSLFFSHSSFSIHFLFPITFFFQSTFSNQVDFLTQVFPITFFCPINLTEPFPINLTS